MTHKQWPHRFFWSLTTVPWGNTEDYFATDIPADTREYTSTSPEIIDVNFPPHELGRPIRISLHDRDHKIPTIHSKIPQLCEPVYYRLESIGFDPLGRVHEAPYKLHVIGFAITNTIPAVRVMTAVDEKSGTVFSGIMDNKRHRPTEKD